LVTVSHSGSEKPYTLPPNPKSYRLIPCSALTPDSWGETVLSPRYETTWRVRAPAGSGHSPAAAPFQPRKAQP